MFGVNSNQEHGAPSILGRLVDCPYNGNSNDDFAGVFGLQQTLSRSLRLNFLNQGY